MKQSANKLFLKNTNIQSIHVYCILGPSAKRMGSNHPMFVGAYFHWRVGQKLVGSNVCSIYRQSNPINIVAPSKFQVQFTCSPKNTIKLHTKLR